MYKHTLKGEMGPITFADPVPDLSQPVPMVFRRAKEGEAPTHWVGGSCLANDEYWAKRFIRMDDPGYMEYVKASGFLSHPVFDCYNGNVEYGDLYADSPAEWLVEYDGDEPPSYLHVAEEVPFEPNFEGWLESYCSDEHHEDAWDQIDWTGFDEFVSAWVKMQNIRSWRSTHKIVVIDQVKFDTERAEAQRIVDEWQAGEPVKEKP